MNTVHGTTVAIDGKGVLLQGPPGCGKSDLALRLIDRGAILVADDRSTICREGDCLIVAAPAAIRNKLEVRGVGIVPLAALERVRLALAVDLSASSERLPSPETIEFLGVAVRLLRLHAFESSAGAKVRLAVRSCCNDIES